MEFTHTLMAEYVRGTGLLESDGVIGIPVRWTLLFDSGRFPQRKGFGGTPVMLYIVNAHLERIGTTPDETILRGMLERGFAVIVLDYQSSERAASPALDLSVQSIRNRIMKGALLAECDGFGEGKYPETLVVPAGYDVSFGHVYWQFDKHGADGSLDKIVEIWNNDFRGTKGESLVRWTDGEGKRKAVQCGHDGSEVVWLDENGDPASDGAFVRVKHTWAKTITDCVRPDGSPLDLKLYMHLIYPTNPAKKVPVLCLAGSSECLCAGSATADRPHLNGAVFNGYAGVLFDYGYTPMARNDHYGYFDGYPRAGYITGDNTTYSLKHYNDFSDTAAMRFIRYLSLTDARFACLDTDAIGVYGNSKGGWMTHLGAKDPNAAGSRRIFPGHHGETRFENGDTETRNGICGGEEQPWLQCNGEKIFGGANFIYSSCGATWFSVTEGHAPLFVSCNRRDESCFGTSNSLANLGRVYNIPTMRMEIPLGHTLVHDTDLLFGTDSYRSFFAFADYFLKKDAVRALGVKVNRYTFPASVTVLFSGSVDEAEAEKITLLDADGRSVAGKRTSAYGGIEWTFTPDDVLYGADYTVSVPADLCGDNGKTVAEAYSHAVDLGTVETVPVRGEWRMEEKGDRRYIAFAVENDGVNAVGAYLPDGTCLGTVHTSGQGWYKIDVTALGTIGGESLILKAERPAQNVRKACALTLCESAVGEQIGENAAEVRGFETVTKFPTEEFYTNPVGALCCTDIIKDGPLCESDVGRRFRIRFKVWDSVSRYINFGLNHCSNRPAGIADYRRVMGCARTRAGEWSEYTLDYTVYEPLHGEIGCQKKSFYLNAFGAGTGDTPFRAAELICEETVTDVQFGKVCLVYEYGEKPLQPGESDIECPKAAWTK